MKTDPSAFFAHRVILRDSSLKNSQLPSLYYITN